MFSAVDTLGPIDVGKLCALTDCDPLTIPHSQRAGVGTAKCKGVYASVCTYACEQGFDDQGDGRLTCGVSTNFTSASGLSVSDLCTRNIFREILGCTDSNADNYNPFANADNAGCEYSSLLYQSGTTNKPAKCGRTPPLLHATLGPGSVTAASCSFDINAPPVDGSGSVSCDLVCGTGFHLNNTGLSPYPDTFLTRYTCTCSATQQPLSCGWLNMLTNLPSVPSRLMQCLAD